MSLEWEFGTLRQGSGSSAADLTVVKLGGSLLARRQWPVAVAGLLAHLPKPLALVVGGGPVVDGLRHVDAAAPQDPDLMHRLAIDALRLTARLVAESLGMPLVTAVPTASPIVVLDVAAWLETRPPAADLPSGWHVTSDSIAAAVAAAHAAELVLVKSVRPPGPDDDLAALAEAGWVDPHLAAAAASLDRICWAAPARA